MTEQDIRALEQSARRLRYLTIDEIAEIGVGHVGGSLSICDLLAVLYDKVLRVDPKNPKMEGRDRLILSKGHAGPALYAALAHAGFFPEDWLMTLNRPGTLLPSHCDMNRTPGIDMTCGSLGQGIAAAVGMAYGSKLKKDDATIYCIIGDGETNEGSVWEAAMFAAHNKLDNFVAITDNNNMQVDGTLDEVIALPNLAARWEAFGFLVREIDGHDVGAIHDALMWGKSNRGSGKPTMIVARTVKGKGLKDAEDRGVLCHNYAITPDMRQAYREELK